MGRCSGRAIDRSTHWWELVDRRKETYWKVRFTGLAGMLTKFLAASFATASSVVWLNGRPTPEFHLRSSVRQGCPLSPLLFNIAFEALGVLFQDALWRGSMQGVLFPSLQMQLLYVMYADDLSLVIRATLHTLREGRRLLKMFGQASGLECAWDQTVAAFIPGGPPSPDFWLESWTWEDDSGASNLLGFPIAQSVSASRMVEIILEKLDNKLAKFESFHLSLPARIIVANSIILGSIWYLITLWAGDLSFLNQIQSRIDRFIWAGRPRVRRATVTNPKAMGGLGLLSVMDHFNAMIGNLMLWILSDSFHPLQRILQQHITSLSYRKWGHPDFTWVVSQCGRMEYTGSNVWGNICKGWAQLKPLLVPSPPSNSEAWGSLPLWRPHVHHINASLVKCSSLAQRQLREAGLETMADITDGSGQLLRWAQISNRGNLNSSCEAAFSKLQRNVRQFAPEGSLSLTPLFLESYEDNPHRIWQYMLPEADFSVHWRPLPNSPPPKHTFRLSGNCLSILPTGPPPQNLRLRPVLIRDPVGSGQTRSRFKLWQGNALFTQYRWKDDTPLLNTSTAQLRHLQCLQRNHPHQVLARWERRLNVQIPESIWSSTWSQYRSAKENSFLWQLLYNAIATQRWRFPRKAISDPALICSRCSMDLPEDTLHCIWGCSISQRCWDWATRMLETVAATTGPSPTLQAGNVILAVPLPDACHIPERFWQVLRATLCWQIWKDRNSHFFSNQVSDHCRIVSKTWHRFSVYIRYEWLQLTRKIRNRRLSVAEAITLMQLHYGSNSLIWTLHELVIQVPPVPPRPP